MNITKQQIKILHAALNARGLMDMKRSLILSATRQRTASSKEMTKQEATFLINFINNRDSCNRMRRKVWALAFECGILYGDTQADYEMNKAKINQFLLKRETVKKPLQTLTHQELIKTVNQFEKIAEHTREQGHKKELDKLLKDSSITYERKKTRK